MADMKTMACALITSSEGCFLPAYQDGNGVWTIGFGNTFIYGRPVRRGDKLPNRAEALTLFLSTLDLLIPKLEKMVKIVLKPYEEAALLSWQYNVGSGAAAGSTLIRVLNLGNRAMAANEFARWDMDGGRVVAGLANRRALERRVFLGLLDPTIAAAAQKPIVSHPAPKKFVASIAAPSHNVSSATDDLNAAELARVA